MLKLESFLVHTLLLIILITIGIPMLLGKGVECVGRLIVVIGEQLQRPYKQKTPQFIKNISNKLGYK